MHTYSKILAHIPHASIHDYSFGWCSSALLFPEVKRLTDWHTEILFDTTNPKVDVMVFPHSRFYVDVERLEHDPLEEIGQGMIYTKYNGFERYLLTSEDKDTLKSIYYDWKKECDGHIVDNTLVIDCHSFPSDISEDIDVCIGFKEDESKPDEEVIFFIVDEFRKHGYTVGINTPYSNSVVFDKPHHSLMIELNKRIYMNEDTLLMDPKTYILGCTIHRIYNTLTA